ncbi:hypothetical protein GH754_17935 [Salinibacillus xinjiangensis]|uniref:Deoxyribokinase n=2 Tax=Salinibacillus xinjiangensis TaxID=1229268 RepID=A0A6G1XB85_9BACI|nr:hypothetical protein [Salinibacillus xinjiangensis]
MDLYAFINRMPYEGETLASNQYFESPGGKALNQAVTVARMGKSVSLIGKIGRDAYGAEIIEKLISEGIRVDHISTNSNTHTGNSFVLIDGQGNNTIITNLGANQCLSIKDVNDSLTVAKNASVALIQLEMPSNVRKHLIRQLNKLGIKIVLNLAPIVELPIKIRRLVDILIVNEIEAEQLTGTIVHDSNTAEKAANILGEQGNQNVVITLGSNGAVVKEDNSVYVVDAPKVKVVDSTGAGDCFCGSLGSFLLENDIKTAVEKAVKVAALSVTKSGTLYSIPSQREVYTYLNEKGRLFK